MLSIYYKKNHWKVVLLVIAVIIGAVSLYYTNRVVENIARQEKKKVELWARATKEISSAEEIDQNQEFLLDILRENDNIPVILTDDSLNILSYLNIDNEKAKDSDYLKRQLLIMQQQHAPIVIEPFAGLRQYIFYKDSDLLYQLRYYPYFQLGVICVFLLVSYFAFSLSRRYEQDFLWVGMAKETAHQLGTPISSLMAWHEYLKTTADNPDDEMLTEVGKDLDRLQVITERFSKIGSMPVLETQPLAELLEKSVGYMQRRTTDKVKFHFQLSTEPIQAAVNAPLIDWVLENLIKNALDAMNGAGQIEIRLKKSSKNAIIDLSDTGRGIPKNQFQNIFKPGITTRKRGWGLGLTLVKRIIEKYHRGKIFVKESEPGKGTTFRILLPLQNSGL